MRRQVENVVEEEDESVLMNTGISTRAKDRKNENDDNVFIKGKGYFVKKDSKEGVVMEASLSMLEESALSHKKRSNYLTKQQERMRDVVRASRE